MRPDRPSVDLYLWRHGVSPPENRADFVGKIGPYFPLYRFPKWHEKLHRETSRNPRVYWVCNALRARV